MSAKSISEDPKQWARDHTYHWFWGMVRVRRGDQKTVDTWWHEYSGNEAKQKELQAAVVRYRKKNFISRFFIWLFNSENMSLKLKLYEFFMRYDPAMFVTGERDSNMTNEDGMLNAMSKGAGSLSSSFWSLFFKKNSCIQNDTVPKDSGRDMEEKHDDEAPSAPEVWPPHDDAMTRYLAVSPLHFTDTELQAAQEDFVIDSETKLAALQEWEEFYQQHMAKSGARDEKSEAQVESAVAIGSKYRPQVIGKQWRQMGLTFHPDKGGTTEDSQRINELKEFLTQEPCNNSESSPWALRDGVCQFRTKVNDIAKQRSQNWHAATEKYIEASWAYSEESPDTPDQLEKMYYTSCEAAFKNYRMQRETACRELMMQYAVQKSKYSEHHPVAKGYAKVIAKRAQLEREWRLADLKLYREGCQIFFEPVVDDLKEQKKEWLEEREDLRRKSKDLKEEASDLEEKLKKLEESAFKLNREEAELRDHAERLDAKSCELRKGYLVADKASHVFDQGTYQRRLELHKSSKSSYENSLARHQKQTESAPKQIFSYWKSIYTVKSFYLMGAYSPMSFEFWKRELTECSEAIAYLVDLKTVYPADVPSHAAPKPPLPIMFSLGLYHHLHNQAAYPASDSEREDKKKESEVALDGAADELSSMEPSSGVDSAQVTQALDRLKNKPFFSIPRISTYDWWLVGTKKLEPSAKEGLASSPCNRQPDSPSTENPTAPEATRLTHHYDNVTARNNHQEQKSKEPPDLTSKNRTHC